MNRKEEGMTILEVVIAITILLIGTSFIVQSNSLSYNYLRQQELHQQMVFFAAGRMEAVLIGQTANPNPLSENLEATLVPFTDLPDISDSLKFKLNGVDYDLNHYLKCFGVTVSAPGFSDDYKMYNYKLELELP